MTKILSSIIKSGPDTGLFPEMLFHSQVDITSDCWLWRGFVDEVTGRGYLKIDDILVCAQIASHFFHNKEYSENVLHTTCGNVLCVNPNHLITKFDMNFNEYQEAAFKLALPTTRNINYMILGLTNESGEVAGKYKKVLRGDTSLEEVKEKLADELADVLWYVSGAAQVLGITLSELAQMNLAKLHGRAERGTLQGNGDNR